MSKVTIKTLKDKNWNALHMNNQYVEWPLSSVKLKAQLHVCLQLYWHKIVGSILKINKYIYWLFVNSFPYPWKMCTNFKDKSQGPFHFTHTSMLSTYDFLPLLYCPHSTKSGKKPITVKNIFFCFVADESYQMPNVHQWLRAMKELYKSEK